MVHRTNQQVYGFNGTIVKYPKNYHDPIPVEYCKHNMSKGVRKNILLLRKPPKQKLGVLLLFDRPCVCGSTLHSSTRSKQCLLNNRYLDD